MKNLYEKNTANYPRLKTDALFTDFCNTYDYKGVINKTMHFAEDFQLLDTVLWRRFVSQFKENADGKDLGWRGEYWGKMMRGACFVYSYTKNPELYKVLKQTVLDMLDSQENDGRISSYAKDSELDGWDMWGRKYVLLGMQYFAEICGEEDLNKRIVDSMCRQLDYIMSKVGDEEGKKRVTETARLFYGVNSASILEPVVRLYNITQNTKYIKFAEHIVKLGGSNVENLFELAYQNEMYPYQYPVTKAYEITSCFEGLLEYYRAVGGEEYKQAVINFADRLLESEFTIVGGCGCSHELFDRSAVRQANTTNGKVGQETCVTVTVMKFFYQVTLLTGDPKYVDAFETSLYNAYLGAVNTEKIISPSVKKTYEDCVHEPFPFDSYSPLTAETRGNGVGGLKVMSDKHYYGCCACIGSAGIGLVSKIQLLTAHDGFAMNLYISGTAQSKTLGGQNVTFETVTEYPKCGKVKIIVKLPETERFALRLRNPKWSKNTKITVCGKAVATQEGYVKLERRWSNGDVIELEFDMRTEALFPISYGEQILMTRVKIESGIFYTVPKYDKEDPLAKRHIALRRGPIILAQDNRLGYSVDKPAAIKVKNGYVDVVIPDKDEAPFEHITEARVPLENGEFMTVTDYASAGKLWNEESKMAAWILTE